MWFAYIPTIAFYTERVSNISLETLKDTKCSKSIYVLFVFNFVHWLSVKLTSYWFYYYYCHLLSGINLLLFRLYGLPMRHLSLLSNVHTFKYFFVYADSQYSDRVVTFFTGSREVLRINLWQDTENSKYIFVDFLGYSW
jgi:hypothetical protein